MSDEYERRSRDLRFIRRFLLLLAIFIPVIIWNAYLNRDSPVALWAFIVGAIGILVALLGLLRLYRRLLARLDDAESWYRK